MQRGLVKEIFSLWLETAEQSVRRPRGSLRQLQRRRRDAGGGDEERGVPPPPLQFAEDVGEEARPQRHRPGHPVRERARERRMKALDVCLTELCAQLQSRPAAVGGRLRGEHGGRVRREHRADAEPAGLLQRHPRLRPAARLLC